MIEVDRGMRPARSSCGLYLGTFTVSIIASQNDENPPNVRATLTHESTTNTKLKTMAGGTIRQGCGRLKLKKTLLCKLFKKHRFC